MKNLFALVLLCFLWSEAKSEESPYKINDLRLELDSITSFMDSSAVEDSSIAKTYLGVAGGYLYNRPSGKYVGALDVTGSFNADNDDAKVGVARLGLDLAKKNGKEQFDFSVVTNYKNDSTDLSYEALESQFYPQFERRQLDDLNASGRDDLTNTELKNVENLALKSSFDNVYRPNNKVRLDLGGTVSFYQIKGLYTDRQRAQINRDLAQGRFSYSKSFLPLWSAALSYDYGFLSEKDTSSLVSGEVYAIRTTAQNAKLSVKRSQSANRFALLYIDYKGLRYSESPDQNVFIPGIDWSFKVNSKTSFEIGLSEGVFVDKNNFSGRFYPSFALSVIPSSRANIKLTLSEELENIVDYFFMSEIISSPLQESLTEKQEASVYLDYGLRRAQIKVALNDTRRLFFGSNSFEHTKRYLVDYIYILSRKLDVELGFNGYDFTRKVNDRVLNYNTDGYYLRFGVKYRARNNRRTRGSSSFSFDYKYGNNSDKRLDLQESQNIMTFKIDFKV